MKKREVSVKALFCIIFIIVVFIMGLFVLVVREAKLLVREQIQIEENRRLCELESQTLADASDYLTNEVWHFVANHNPDHLNNYWREVDFSKNRDQAIERLISLSLTEKERALVESAKEESDRLIQSEAWAMRLVADAIGMSAKDMPDKVAAVRYTRGEGGLEPDRKLSLASGYIFGSEYTAVKDVIKDNIQAFRQRVRDRKNMELETAVGRTQNAIRGTQYLMIALIVLIAAEAGLFYFFIIRPFNIYSLALGAMGGRQFHALEPVGARETKTLALAFNQIYAEWEEQNRRLEQEGYRFRVAMDNTSVIIYEYDCLTDVYTAYGSLEPGIEAERILPDFMKDKAEQIIGKAGMEFARKLVEGSGGLSGAELQVHPEGDMTRLIWAKITGTPVYDENKRVVKIIGKISNIQAEKENEIALEDARSRDGLTGLYSREAGIRKVRDFMKNKSPHEICGLMLLDMDNFGQINEVEGCVYADAVLRQTADILRSNTGEEDILVRLGGDEFMLFIKGCPKSRATLLGPQIAAGIQELSVNRKSGMKISASIGMCVTEVVDEYSGLYRCAESTLKYVKEYQKGTAACYLDTSNELGMLLTRMYPESHFINEIDRAEGNGEDLASFALDLLGNSKNLDDAIFLLLARVGSECHVDRILISEINTDFLNCRISHQWTRNAEDRLAAETWYFTKEEFLEMVSSYDQEGLSDKKVQGKSSNMESILYAPIWNYDMCVGNMSFEKKSRHDWTEAERRILGEMTKIISSFTLKARADAVSQAKTDFLSRMSHEIRTPMNAITGMTAIAKTVLYDPQRTLDCLNKIESANRYLLSLINDVLDMSRIESGKVEIHTGIVDLEELTGNIKTLIRPQTQAKDQALLVENSYCSGPVIADELRLSQILVNLLGNAVKFTGEGGEIRLKIEQTGEDEAGVKLRFSVKDTGIGISKEAQGRIFKAFEQAGSDTSYTYGGTGLGLAISSKLVTLMGGALEVSSELGEGSEFYFTLPLPRVVIEEEAERAKERRQEAPPQSFDPRGKRLLLVEDNELNQEIAQELLSMRGFCVETAENGAVALKMFWKNEAYYYDAILMDIRMPYMDGMEATRRIRTMGKQDSRTVPIIAMTANAFDEDMKKSLENGMDGHLSKPIDIDALIDTLKKLITVRRRPDRA